MKNKNLVAILASRFFLDENACKKLAGKTLYLVPPNIDIKREFAVKEVRLISQNKIEISLEDSDIDGTVLTGKSFLISHDDAKDVFGSSALSENKEYTGKLIVDKELGEIGTVKDVAGTSAQKHLIVDYNGSEVLIPISDDLIEEESKTEIKMKLPKGLLSINEA